MNKDTLIKKWLNHSLNTEEQKAFEDLEDYTEFIKLDDALSHFKAPEFSPDKNYQILKPKIDRLRYQKNKHSRWLKVAMSVAAVVIIGFGFNYFGSSKDVNINTTIAEQTLHNLPDASEVELNANSSITYNSKAWNANRVLSLKGEAFFKVAKGETFDVITTHGMVRVLGTQFNVKQRDAYFEVICYEGLVAVTYNDKITKLNPGDVFTIRNGKQIANEKVATTKPEWLSGESSFKNVPLKYVIAEFENHYHRTINPNNVDTSRLFTGTLTHKNIDLALKAIAIPLQLSYTISKNHIELKRE